MAWSSLDMYSHGLDFFSGVVDRVPPQRWASRSPCEGWSALDVLGHVGEATEMGVRILRGGDMSFTRHDPPSSVVGPDPAAWWAGLAADARAALGTVDDLDREVDSPMGKRTIREGLSFPAVDLYIHGWDVAASVGEEVELPAEAIAFVHELFEKVPAEVSRRPGVFGDAREATAGASATEELIAWTGRERPRP